MKNTISILLFALFTACGSSGENKVEEDTDHSAHMDESTEQPKSKSPKQMAMVNVGKNHIHIEYSSPSVRGRQIFGGLVGFGQVWVTGAHKATSIHFQNDVMIDGKNVPSGKYGFFTIPGKESWTLILNEDWDMHLADEYNEANDVLRLTVTPERLEESVESLTYEVTPIDDNSGTISISWADTKVSFKVENKQE